MLFQIRAGDRRADALQIGSDLAADIAAIEIAEPGFGEMLQRGGEGGLLELGALLRCFAADQKRVEEAGRGFQFCIFVDGQPGLTARHRIALARVPDGGVEQHMQRQTA